MDKSSRILERIERLQQLNSNKAWINDDLYRLMYREELYIIAYERIKSKPGNLTPGTDGATLDGFSLEKIQMIIREMRSEQFQFKPVRTVYIPKPNGKMSVKGNWLSSCHASTQSQTNPSVQTMSSEDSSR